MLVFAKDKILKKKIYNTHLIVIRLFVPYACRDKVMVFNTTFNNISVISRQSVILVEETRVSEENHRPASSHQQTLPHNVVSSTPRHKQDSNLQLY